MDEETLMQNFLSTKCLRGEWLVMVNEISRKTVYFHQRTGRITDQRPEVAKMMTKVYLEEAQRNGLGSKIF